MSTPNPFIALEARAKTLLQDDDRFPKAGHLWSQQEIDALILAHAARRPLLVRGEAGSGKSQIARAAAAVMNKADEMKKATLLVEVIHPRFEALDLLYRFDAIDRLADAQIEGELDRTNKKYVRKGQLWKAILQAKDGGAEAVVLLIDEIDKADADVPNTLLDVLGNRSFTVPYLDNLCISAEDGRLPLIIITTNEERELPAAFVRRCVVLNLNPPGHEKAEGEAAFIDWLVARGQVHEHLNITDEARQLAARQVLVDRKTAIEAGYPKVGLAEYIDLLTALDELTTGVPSKRRAEEQSEWLNRLSAYALVKHAEQQQDREPVMPPAGTGPD